MAISQAIPCMWMRGGTSKGGYFLAADLPADPAARDPLRARWKHYQSLGLELKKFDM